MKDTQLSTATIIKILPFDEGFKVGLLEKMSSFDADQKYAIEQLLWRTYAAYYDILFQSNMKIIMDKISKGELKMDKQLSEMVEDQTDKDVEAGIPKELEEFDLSTTRHELEEIMKNPTSS